MYKILMVEDDAVIASSIEAHLSRWGYEIRCGSDFHNIMGEFAEFAPQLVLLDISLPFFNGFHWCAEIRRQSKTPVIFISSASDNMNIVMAMNMGGDDFITKPFDLNVLTAKVQAMLRRTYEFESAGAGLMEHQGAVLNTGDFTLTFGSEKIELTKNEYRILLTLMENRGYTVSRDELMARLWENDSYVDDNTLTVNVNRLRKRLESAGLHDYIQTKKGVGYILG